MITSSPTSDGSSLDSVNNPRHPFGLPMGSVRGFFSLLICGFFWMILLWPSTEQLGPPIRAVLGHFFMLALVLLAFASSPSLDDRKSSPVLPWILRVLFVGGSVAVVAVCLVRNPAQFQARITPDPNEFADWWAIYLGITAGGFALGLFLRFILGRTNPIFLTIRAWLSVIGMVMLAIEYAIFVGYVTAENKPLDLFRTWQAIELAFVSAYFGTRT